VKHRKSKTRAESKQPQTVVKNHATPTEQT